MFSLKDVEWKKMRTKLTALFTSSKIKMMFQSVETIADVMKDVVEEACLKGESVAIKELAAKYTNDCITSCAFGIDLNALKNKPSKLRQLIMEFVGAENTLQSLKIMFASFAPEVLRAFKLRVFSSEIEEFFTQLVENTIKYREDNGVIRKDFLQLMIQLKNNIQVRDEKEAGVELENGNSLIIQGNQQQKEVGLTIQDIAAQAVLFYGAGFETSATAISFTLMELSVNEDFQDKLRSEILNVLQEHDQQMCYEAIANMTYLDSCIRETLRKYPSLPHIFRECTKTYKVPNTDTIIEKGTLVFVPITQIHYDPEYYPDPDIYSPDRFSSECASKRHNCAWLPFGDGPRICIGMRLGMMQIKLSVVKIIKDFRITLDPKTKYPITLNPRGFTLTSLEEIYLKFEKI